MKTKGIEEMSKEELISALQVTSLELEGARKDAELYLERYNEIGKENDILKEKLNVIRSFAKII